MKRLIYTIAILAFTFQGCSSDDSSNPTTNPTTGFTWKENGGTEIKADSAYYESAFKTIKAFKDHGSANSKFIEINLTAGTPADYDVTNGNAIALLQGNDLYIASTGMITITENASNKMSGNFTSTSSSGTTTALEGTFKSIEIR